MSVRIGLVGVAGGEDLAETLRPLLPRGATLETYDIPEALRLVVGGELMLLIAALDGPSWHETLTRMMALYTAGREHTFAVFGLVPRDDPAALVTAFELGVADVAALPIDPHEVRARLAALIRRRQVAVARAAETRAAWRLAMIDPVTGLYNRHHLDSSLPAAIDSARAGNRPLSLLIADVDSLKSFNDRWGHPAGDRALRSLAGALQGSLRLTDVIARYGGDEIVVVMPDTDGMTARAIAAQLIDTVALTPVGRVGDGPRQVTISIGLAVLTETDAGAESLLARADAALYCAKRAGRSQVAEAA